MTEERDERALFYSAAESLTEAYRELGNAADCLREVLGGQSRREFLMAVGDAKDAINRAKDVIGA